ncbi:hypothetical protein CHISP_2369 [Chitinispirillum alkaliphilum]|nr:hypothetical protein CHISP_2369 [Chitinispirillum alkaliphilum]
MPNTRLIFPETGKLISSRFKKKSGSADFSTLPVSSHRNT